VQRALIDLGYDLGLSGADGIYGHKTEASVKAFKKKEQLGFEQFGDVGPATMHRLDRIFAEDTAEDAVPSAQSGRDRTFSDEPGDRKGKAGGPFEASESGRILVPLAPPQALTVPAEEGDCIGPVADADGVEPVIAVAFRESSPRNAGGPVPIAGPSGSAAGSPCDFAPAPPGSISDFESDLRDHPDRIIGVVVDPESQEIIGYRVRTSLDILRVVDREGNFVDGDEKGLDQPFLDPIDFIPSPGTVAKGAVIVGKVGLKALGKFVVKAEVKEGFRIAAGSIPKLRAVSAALIGRAGRAASKKLPTIVERITIGGLEHSFDSHAAQFFGRSVGRATHFELWRKVVEQGAKSSLVFPWTLRGSRTIAHLATIEGKQFVVHFFEETGELASAFVPTTRQVRAMRRLIDLMK
jgi:hypothetical protein